MERILEDISQWSIENRSEKIGEIYKERIGVPLNLRNPKRFTEKIQWLKLYENNPVISRCIDKLRFKQYVREKIGDGWTAPLIDVWHRPEDVCLDNVPEPCVVKSNCSGNGKYIYIIKKKSEIDIPKMEQEIKKFCFDRRYLHTNSFFKAYYDVTPCVLVEDYLSEIETGIDEYKFFCFNGEPKYIYHSDNHFKNGENTECTVSFYDMQWKFQNVQYGNHLANPHAPKPKFLSDMTQISKKLAKDFSFVRVDFFESSTRFYIAELTFAVGAGLTPYSPESFDYELGALWKMDTNNMCSGGGALYYKY